jgi:Predicted nucleotide-binding protein containing TIR-like domain
MSHPRPALFIGSSTPGLDVARAVEINLKDDAEVTVWCSGVFGLSHGTLQSLVAALDRFDFAVLILTPDDVISSHDISSQAPRDNVLFELGLFMGRLGPTRTFVVCSDAAMKLPSDLAGVTLAHYESRRIATEPKAAVSPACFDIRQSVRSLGFTPARSGERLASAATAVESISERVTRLVHLLARSRVLELDVITKQFGPVLPRDFATKLLKDLRELEEATTDNDRNG